MSVGVRFDDLIVLQFFDNLRVTRQIIRINQIFRRYAIDRFRDAIVVAVIDSGNAVRRLSQFILEIIILVILVRIGII